MRKGMMSLFMVAAAGLVAAPGEPRTLASAAPVATPLTTSVTPPVTTVMRRPGESKTFVLTPQGVAHTDSVQVEGPIPVIVQLREAPLLARRNVVAALAAGERAGQLVEHQKRLNATQASLKAWIQALEPGMADSSFRQYSFAFNGIATTVLPETLKQLKQHPDVVRVFRDEVAHATLATSVPLIGAPQMWNTYGADGRGIRVAVLDTGIDYTHPDLGGGLGSSFKVIGGYDFIHGNANPMDDHGHGTHVAGIIAANGTAKGVAPGASLLAYKVLDASGSGPISVILAGIDRAVDPDQNPATNDAPQVISMSLGGPGDANDPLSQAVDAAVNAGVVCVVAAGNSGSGYSTLGSPGCAQKALTVGATDNLDVIAWFSSRGPSQPGLAIKPDVTAPGVGILSTKPGGGYQALSGTSMATPHVSGAVALLLQLHPTWTPEVVKGVLAEKAKDLGLDAFTQGSGRIQVVASHLAKGVALPNNLNFGVVDVAQAVWAKTLPLRLQNLDGTSRTYALAMQGSLPAGVTWSLNPSSVALGAGQSQDVSLTLTVDNSAAPYGPPPTLAFGARLVATAADDVLAVPVVVYKAAQLSMTFDREPDYVALFDRNMDAADGFSSGFYKPANKALSVLLPPRRYDAIAVYSSAPGGFSGRSFLVKENLDVTGRMTLPFELDREPMHRIVFGRLDEAGKDVSFQGAQSESDEFALNHVSGFNILSVGNALGGDYHFSSVSAAYAFDRVHSAWLAAGGIHKYFEFKYAIRNGVDKDLTLDSSPVRRIGLNFNLDATVGQAWVDMYRYVNQPGIAIGFSSSTWWPSAVIPQVLDRPFEMEAHLSVMPGSDFTFNQTCPWVATYNGSAPGQNVPVLTGGLIGVPDLSTLNVYHLLQPGTPFYTTHADRLVMGESPHGGTGKLQFTGMGSATLSGGNGYATPLYLGQTGGSVIANLPYDFVQGGAVVQSGVIPAYLGNPPSRADLSFAPGAYTLRMPFNAYLVNGQRGQIQTELSFDSTKADPAPPYLKRLRILKDGEASSQTLVGRQNQLSLLLADDVGLAQVQAFYQTTGAWQPLPLPLPAGLTADFLVDLPATLPEGPVNLKILASDAAGNSLAEEWLPAFHHAKPVLPTIDTQPQGVRVNEGQTATFTVVATGTGPLTYQWRKGGTAIGGAVSSSYTTPVTALSDDGALYSVMVTSPYGSALSSEAMLNVQIAPTMPAITSEPQDVTVGTGGTATFRVTAMGTGPLAYQWLRRGVLLPGATADAYTTPPATIADQGATYSVTVSNGAGSVSSRQAVLTVLLPVVDLLPATLSCFPGDAATFTAKVTHAADDRVTWTASAGLVDALGHFTAPATPGTVTVTATSVADPTQKATARVTVRGTNFDGNSATNPKLLGLAHAMGSTDPADLAKYDFNGDGQIDDADLAQLFQKMGW